MATIVYLDAEDEITSAAARIRAAADTRVGLVLPFGSRVATSRINFKLLAREAMSHGRRLDIVAPDASARALAASAGLPVFGSVAEYEGALDVQDDDRAARRAAAAAAGVASARAEFPGGAAGAGTAGAADAPDTPEAAAPSSGTSRPASDRTPATRVPATGATGGSRPSDVPEEARIGAAAVASGRQPAATPAPRRRRRAGRIIGALVVLVVVAGAVAAAGYLVLPSAAITVTPRIEAVGPVSFDVRADPAATAVDTDAGVIPAQTVSIPVTAKGDFQATGKRIERTPAHGNVRWTNCDPTAPYQVPSGTIVRTSSGIGFSTDEALFLPVAVLTGGGASPKLECQSSEVAITAVEPGPQGNVPAGTIRVVPARYNRTVIRVNNPQATSGGARREFTRVSQKDVDAAVEQVTKDLRAAFEKQVADPSAVPEGTTVFPDTAVLGDAVPDVDPRSLVLQEVDTFSLGMSADGTVLAVDATPARAVAESRLSGSIDEGYELVDDSTTIDVGDGRVVDGVVTFPVEASAKQVRPVDAAALRSSVLGLPVADARRLLEPYGDVSIQLWPGWVSSVPSLQQRVTLDVAPAAEPVPSAG